ncbi:MAG: HAD family phosphatase [Anaerolineae bacterium]
MGASAPGGSTAYRATAMGGTAYGGLIFDLNGVLWWDSHLQEQAWSNFSARLRGRLLSPAEMAVHVHGRPNRHTLAYLLGRPLAPGEEQQLGEEKERIYRRLCLAQGDDFCLSPGAVELLDFLATRSIPRTIATASGRQNLDFFLAHLGLARWFDPDRIVYDDGTRPGKPAPDVYLTAAQRLDLAPARCIVVEDALSGIQAARAAGIGCIVALGPPEKHSALAALDGVDTVVESLAQLPIHPRL